jgi:hypothetical protein
MKNKTKHDMLLLTIAGLALVALNVEVWMASRQGVMGTIENVPLWCAFVSLNVVSVLWAISQLGLQPLIVALSYAAGGFLACLGVRDIPGMSTAEITTAGATYGAFGALAIGNITTKVRLAFFNKKQVPFVFVIVALLAFDGILNSRISHSDWNTVLNALVFPFVLAGGIVSMVWYVVSRLVQDKPEVPVEKTVERESVAVQMDTPVKEKAGADTRGLVIQMPEAVADEVVEEDPGAVVAKEETVDAVAKEEPTDSPETPAEEIVLEDENTGADKEKVDPVDEEFFPLEIDKEETDLPSNENDDLMEIAALLADGTADDFMEVESSGAESEVPVDTPEKPDFSTISEAEAVMASLTDGVNEAAKVVEEDVVESAAGPEPEAKSDADWLSNHLDVLNKLK